MPLGHLRRDAVVLALCVSLRAHCPIGPGTGASVGIGRDAGRAVLSLGDA